MKTSNKTTRALEKSLQDDGILGDLVGDVNVNVVFDTQTILILGATILVAMYAALLLAKITRFGS